MIYDVLIQTLLFLPLTFSIYLSYRILKRTDLTVEGSYVLAAGIFALMLKNDFSYLLSFFTGSLCGVVTGFCMAYIQKGISSLLASIIMLFLLSGITIQIMGTPNISLVNHPINPIHIILIVSTMAILIYLLMTSHIGLRLRGLGNNERLLKKLNYRTNGLLYFGLILSNTIAAITGIINGQYNGYADIYMGQGLALTAVGLVTIRMQKFFDLNRDFILLFTNTFIFTLLSNLLLYIGINILNLKIILALFLIYILKKGGQNVSNYC